MMAGIRGKDTKPEIIIRKALFARGLRYRLHDKSLPGKPDLVFRQYNAVIMINGCFWHGHDCHLFKWPSTSSEFWRKKIGRNREKDVEVMQELSAMKFRVLTIWECAIKGKTRLDFDQLINDIVKWITGGYESRIIRGDGEC